MAASAPPPHFAGGWADSNRSAAGVNGNGSSSEDNHAHSLGIKMSELTLMSGANYNSVSGPPGLSGSTVSTNSVDDRHHLNLHDTSIDHSSIVGSFRGSTPSSPMSNLPPGLVPSSHHNSNNNNNNNNYSNNNNNHNMSMASPIVGSQAGHHSKNSSATSPMLTLTPNSSVDGNSDLYSVGRQVSSPFQGNHFGDNSTSGPAMPFLRNDNNSNHSNNNNNFGGSSVMSGGSFDLLEASSYNDNDGLLGLDALRDRAYSSPGPMARSFESAPSLRTGLPPKLGGGSGGGGGDAGSSTQRHRNISRNNSGRSASSARPPLSGGTNNNASQSPRSGEPGFLSSSSTAEGSPSDLVVPFPGTRSRGDSPVHGAQTSNNSEIFGAIGRPEFSSTAREWEPSNRRRSIAGTESGMMGARPDYNYGIEQPEYEQYSRRRSIGTESGREFLQQQAQYQQQQYLPQSHLRNSGGYSHGDHGLDHPLSHKFGALPSMSSQAQNKQRIPPIHHQLLPYNPNMIPKPQHQRSFSQPGPKAGTPPDHLGMGSGSLGRYPPSGMEDGLYPRSDPPRYIGTPPPSQSHHVRQHSGDSFRSAQSRRSTSMSQGSLPGSMYDGNPMQKRNSQPSLGSGYYGQPQALPNMYPSMHRMDKDPYDNRRNQYEDDLSLLGEHIEVPADHGVDDSYSHQSSYGSAYSGRMHPQMAPPEAMAPYYSGYEGQQIPHHLPTAGAALPAPKVIYNVKFKRTQRSFVMGPRIQRDLKVGTYVKVEADRGEDLGIVIGKVPAEKFNSFSGRSNFRSGTNDMMPQGPNSLSPPGATDLKCIIRLATHDEVSLLTLKREEEEELLAICRTKVRQRALPMNVVDAEYQFDRHKLTFFFEAEGRVDFRELVRDLFSMYKTRIWMQQLDKNNCSTAGGTSQPPPSAMIDYGTPIIAPASELSEFRGLTDGN